jgi:ABC-type Fe3+ transport system permease subunit
MSNIPWRELLVRIGSVAIVVPVVSVGYQWATRFDPGGPFSGVLSAVGVTGAVSLALLGGGLLVAVGWILGLIPDSGF